MKPEAFRFRLALATAIAGVFLAGAALWPRGGLCGMNPFGGFPRSAAYGGLDNNAKSALCVDCHTRTPGAADNTVRGSHFVHLAGSTTQKTQWERLTPWTGTGYSTTYSKYGAPAAGVNLPAGTAGEVICESCHNMKSNVGRYKVLALDNEASDPNELCEGCHTDATMTAHHPMTGDAIFTRGNLPLSTTAGTALQVPLDNATYPGADKVNCRSCHRVHGSPTVTGARILKKGIGDGVLGRGAVGAERQYDIDPSPNPTLRLVTDFTPLCSSCHTQ